jgi:hypothetical protein
MIQTNIYTKVYDNLEEFLNQDKSILDELKKEIDNLDYLDYKDFMSLVEKVNDYSDYEDDEEDEYKESYLETQNYFFYTLKYVRPYDTIYEDYIAVIDKNLKRIEDQKIELHLYEKNKSTWLELFENKTFEEVIAELLEYKFPTKIN